MRADNASISDDGLQALMGALRLSDTITSLSLGGAIDTAAGYML